MLLHHPTFRFLRFDSKKKKKCHNSSKQTKETKKMGNCGGAEKKKPDPPKPLVEEEKPKSVPKPVDTTALPPPPPVVAVAAPLPKKEQEPEVAAKKEPAPPPIVKQKQEETIVVVEKSPSPKKIKKPLEKYFGFFPAGSGFVEFVERNGSENEDVVEEECETQDSHLPRLNLTDVKHIEITYRGDQFKSVSDDSIKTVIAQIRHQEKESGKKILDNVRVIDISFCDHLSMEGIAILLHACRANLQALYAFPVPRNVAKLLEDLVEFQQQQQQQQESQQQQQQQQPTSPPTLLAASQQPSADFFLQASLLPEKLNIMFAYSDNARVRTHLLAPAIEITQRNPTCSLNWTTLGSCLLHQETATATVNGKQYGEKMCYLTALKHNRKECRAWYNLGVYLAKNPPSTSFVETPSQEEIAVLKEIFQTPTAIKTSPLTSRVCFVRAVESDPWSSFSWNGLGMDIKSQDEDETAKAQNAAEEEGGIVPNVISSCVVTLKRGRGNDKTSANVNHTVKVTAKDCFKRSIECSNLNAAAWVNLANTMDDEQQVSIEITLEKIAPALGGGCDDDDDEDPQQQNQDSTSKTVEEDVARNTTGKKQKFTKIDCYVKSLEIHPLRSKTWNNLGTVLDDDPDEVVLLEEPTRKKSSSSSTAVTAKKSSSSKTKHARPKVFSVEISGEKFTKRQCFVKAVETSKGKDATVWNNLGSCLKKSLTDIVTVDMERQEDEVGSQVSRISAPNTPQKQQQQFDGDDQQLGNSAAAQQQLFYCDPYENSASASNFGNSSTLNASASSAAVFLGSPVKKVFVREDFSKVDCFIQALELQPDFTQAWKNLGLALAGGDPEGKQVGAVTVNGVSLTPLEILKRAVNGKIK